MKKEIPAVLISLAADMCVGRETHATMDSLFMYSGAPEDPPDGSKHAKALEWLRKTNRESDDPLSVLGKIMEKYLEEPLSEDNEWQREKIQEREKFVNAMTKAGLVYFQGGIIAASSGLPSRTLSELIREHRIESIDIEFQRAIDNVDKSPREAVSAASNILESICKVIIADDNLEMPAKKDLPSVWSVVRKHLNIDPSRLEDDDLKKILSGLISIVTGIGALRTHASSAHGAEKNYYKLEPRHARLAINASHTLSMFLLESWKKSSR